MKKVNLNEVKERLENGIQVIFTDGRFQEYLKFASSFRNYSFQNTMLIFLQNSEASMVKGFQDWKKHDRHVKKGEKAIRLLAPLVKKETDEQTKQRKTIIFGFRYVSVFDVSQTEGKALPKPPIASLEGETEGTKRLFETRIRCLTPTQLKCKALKCESGVRSVMSL